MKWCWELLHNYGLAIILFTVLTKIIMLPLSVWVHKNSIKIVKIQPEVNFLKVRYFGDRERIAEEEAKLHKREKYNPLISIIPLAIQIILLFAVYNKRAAHARFPHKRRYFKAARRGHKR